MNFKLLQFAISESSLIKTLPLPTTSPSYLKPATCTFVTSVDYAQYLIISRAVNIAIKYRNTWYRRYFFDVFFSIAASIAIVSFLWYRMCIADTFLAIFSDTRYQYFFHTNLHHFSPFQ